MSNRAGERTITKHKVLLGMLGTNLKRNLHNLPESTEQNRINNIQRAVTINLRVLLRELQKHGNHLLGKGADVPKNNTCTRNISLNEVTKLRNIMNEIDKLRLITNQKTHGYSAERIT
nr:MAG TPA: hypothetical protein [Caudoviricetes sp.]